MKKAWESLIVVVLMIFAPLAVLTCHCADGGCATAGSVAVAQAPQCHHSNKATGTQQGSHNDCCGKCQIERAELSSKKIGDGIVSQTVMAGPAFYRAKDAPRFSHGSFYIGRVPLGDPVDFFTGYIANTTFAFRGPPAG